MALIVTQAEEFQFVNLPYDTEITSRWRQADLESVRKVAQSDRPIIGSQISEVALDHFHRSFDLNVSWNDPQRVYQVDPNDKILVCSADGEGNPDFYLVSFSDAQTHEVSNTKTEESASQGSAGIPGHTREPSLELIVDLSCEVCGHTWSISSPYEHGLSNENLYCARCDRGGPHDRDAQGMPIVGTLALKVLAHLPCSHCPSWQTETVAFLCFSSEENERNGLIRSNLYVHDASIFAIVMNDLAGAPRGILSSDLAKKFMHELKCHACGQILAEAPNHLKEST